MGAELNITRVREFDRQTLAEAVRTELERLILDGALKAGGKLNEITLSEALGVSRGTVREAIRTLSQSGLVELVANRGAFVRKVSAEDVARLYELRGAVFALGCQKAAERTGAGEEPTLVARLESNVAGMRDVAESGDNQGYYRLNILFHDDLMSAADNPHAKDVYDDVVKKMHLFRRRGLSQAGNVWKSIEEHEAIVDAIRNGDGSRAANEAKRHIEQGMQRFLGTLEADPTGAETEVASAAAASAHGVASSED